MSRYAALSVVVLAFVVVSSAPAQVIYEPVEYQYDAGGTTYYYGGSDPWIHIQARGPISPGGTWGRINGHAFVGANRIVDKEPPRVFNDYLGARNAWVYGFTAADARNDAYASVPRYFVKRDLLNAAVPVDGAWVVPAAAIPVHVYKSNGVRLAPGERPATMPRPLMIIPKDGLEKPISPHPSDKQVASAR